MLFWRRAAVRARRARPAKPRNKPGKKTLFPQKRRPRVANQDRDGPLVETANETRQGPKGTPVLWVLAAGLGLALLAFAYLNTTSGANPPGPGPAGPSSDAVPGNAQPTPTNPK